MSENYQGIPQASSLETVQDRWGFPDDCDVMFMPFLSQSKTAGARQRMIIWYHGAPSTSFTNAPLGTFFVDTSTPKFWVKTGAAGTDTWVGAAAS